ncbi:hypothetical protein BV20DRAFT_1005889 [Pilatotrama ljubarskyi]|nr:hypothetical protein BV20DRAFT_1005889 [Pilatotrama ljubarskyi]
MSQVEGPPWYATHPDGKLWLGGVPDRLLRHSGLKCRGIVLNSALKPGVVFRTYRSQLTEPAYVVKVLDLSTEELPIYERLLRDIHCPANHTLPCEILRSEDHPLLIMPLLGDLLPFISIVTTSLSQGIEYLHKLHIAHLDFCEGNTLVAYPEDAACHNTVVVNRVYIIDFDTARQFALGPGSQRAITLPETQVAPPDGSTRFDPYSWDVYCLGRLFEQLLKAHYRNIGESPWLLRQYIKWLIGKERGCSGVCKCRPSATAARRILVVLGWVSPLIEAFSRVAQFFFRSHSTRPPTRL